MIVKSAYVHIPFCRAKCFYCDFNSYPGRENLFKDYVTALILEINRAEPVEAELDSVYFGGGTPTILPPDALASVLDAINSRFGISGSAEVTVEANPGTVDASSISELRKAGFNRLSIGVQSFNDDILERIGRIHTTSEARSAIMQGRDAGFSNISIDLMYALPDQTIEDWQNTLDAALEISPEHISLYELTVEEGTVFGNLRRKCQINLPDEDLQMEMYTLAINSLTNAGYEHYEVSNFAKPGYRSRHNQVYWRNEPYFGFGAGASGYIGGTRYTNISSPDFYIERLLAGESVVESSETVTGRQSMGETVMLGLRMLDGLDLDAFEERYGVSLFDVYRKEVTEFTTKGLLEVADSRLRLTSKGLFLANTVAASFL